MLIIDARKITQLSLNFSGRVNSLAQQQNKTFTLLDFLFPPLIFFPSGRRSSYSWGEWSVPGFQSRYFFFLCLLQKLEHVEKKSTVEWVRKHRLRAHSRQIRKYFSDRCWHRLLFSLKARKMQPVSTKCLESSKQWSSDQTRRKTWTSKDVLSYTLPSDSCFSVNVAFDLIPSSFFLWSSFRSFQMHGLSECLSFAWCLCSCQWLSLVWFRCWRLLCYPLNSSSYLMEKRDVADVMRILILHLNLLLDFLTFFWIKS